MRTKKRQHFYPIMEGLPGPHTQIKGPMHSWSRHALSVIGLDHEMTV